MMSDRLCKLLMLLYEVTTALEVRRRYIAGKDVYNTICSRVEYSRYDISSTVICIGYALF